jgi:hypothetical protein
LFSEDQEGEEGAPLDARNVWSERTLLARTIGKGPSCETGVRNDRHLSLVNAKCYEKLHSVSLINKTCSFWTP